MGDDEASIIDKIKAQQLDRAQKLTQPMKNRQGLKLDTLKQIRNDNREESKMYHRDRVNSHQFNKDHIKQYEHEHDSQYAQDDIDKVIEDETRFKHENNSDLDEAELREWEEEEELIDMMMTLNMKQDSSSNSKIS